jgi:hypothetical protein
MSAAEYRAALQPGPDCPPPPEVELQLRLTNYSRQKMVLRVRGSKNSFGFHLQGPEAVLVPMPRAAATASRIMPQEEVVLEPLQSLTLMDISSLTSSGGLGGAAPRAAVTSNMAALLPRAAYWIESGDYTLSAEYKLWVSPAPPGSSEIHDGFGAVSLRTPKLRLHVESPR